MLDQDRLELYKTLVEKGNKAKAEMQSMITEVNLMKKQSLTMLKDEYGYSGFSDLPKMKDEITSLEELIEKNEKEIKEYIQYVAEKKEQKENVMLG